MTNETITESTPVSEATVQYWAELYRTGQLYNADHRVLVGMLGEFYGVWSDWKEFVESVCDAMGVTTPPDSNTSSMGTLFRTLIPGYWEVAHSTPSNDQLLGWVDNLLNSIFDDSPVEWSTLRRIVSANGALNRAVAANEAFPVVDFLRQAIAAKTSNDVERDYFGNQTNELCGAIAETQYAGTLDAKGADNATEFGDPADRIEIETDPDAGIARAFRTIERVMTGERKCHKVAWFAEQLESLAPNAEAWLEQYTAVVVDEELTV